MRIDHPIPARGSALAILVLVVILARSAIAQREEFPRRIEKDTTWSGTVEIPHDVSISGATVTVEAGTTIRFMGSGSLPVAPRIRLEMPIERPLAPPCSSLRLEGTADQPIIVETPVEYPVGSIVARPAACGSFYASHVIFRRMGDAGLPARPKPALQLRFSREADDVWLSHCRFENCGPVWAEFFGPHASAEIEHCRFEGTQGPLALMLAGRGQGIKRVTHVHADAGLRVECPQVLVQHNTLIGRSAQIDVPTPTARAVTIADNVVHCTESRDVGRYAVRCLTPEARVIHNVLTGGTYVIAAAPRMVKGNVLIGVSDLAGLAPAADSRLERLSLTAPTHYLIGELPARAEITDNLFLGPCYAAISTGPPAHDITIAHNVFDGWSQAHRAIQLLTPVAPSSYRRTPTDNYDAGEEIRRLTAEEEAPAEAGDNEANAQRTTTAPASLQATITHNIFTRYDVAAIDVRDDQPEPLRAVTQNIFAQVNNRPVAVGSEESNLLTTPRQYARFDQLGFALAPTTQQAAEATSAAIESGETSVEEIRRAWFDTYRIKPDSALAGEETFGPR
jgi:hypothetical protein